ncbi:MAG: paraquat-inducible protein A [Candidatus Binatia bacterium]|nr:paraquat-inducible protein A [Candidatus Binatia bacterium]
MYNRPLADPSLIACLDCDLLQRLPDPESPGSVECPRCARTLWARREDSIDRTLALSAAAVSLCLLANSVPILGLSAVGNQAFTTVFGGAVQLWRDGQQLVATLVFFTAIGAPVLQIGFTTAIALGAKRDPVPRWVAGLLAHLPGAKIWTMVEVMMLGTLVALMKIADYAMVIPGIGLFALGALIVVLAALHVVFDPREIWERVEWTGPGRPEVQEQSAQPEDPGA